MEFAITFHVADQRFSALDPKAQAQLQADCRAWDAAREAEGRLILARALGRPHALTVRTSGVEGIDGPFAETKEHLVGIVLVRAESIEEALTIAQSSPLSALGTVEVRHARDVRAKP